MNLVSTLREILIPSYRQHGFCTSLGTLTQLHYVNNLLQEYNQSGEVYMASLDLSGAFDKINWDDIHAFTNAILSPSDLNALRALIVNQCLYLTRDPDHNTIKMQQGVLSCCVCLYN